MLIILLFVLSNLYSHHSLPDCLKIDEPGEYYFLANNGHYATPYKGSHTLNRVLIGITFLCWLTMNHFFKVLLYCLCLHVEAYAQKNLRNNIYGEALGFAGYYSVNYERFQPLIKNRMILAGFNAGFSIEKYSYTRVNAIPMGLKICVGWKGIYGEFGGDYLFIRGKTPDYFHGGGTYYIETSKFKLFHFGVRYQPEKCRIFVRGFLFPFKVVPNTAILLHYYDKPDFFELRDQGKSHVWWGGIDIGYSF